MRENWAKLIVAKGFKKLPKLQWKNVKISTLQEN